MPLTPGSPIGSTIKELHGGKTFAHTKAKFGKERANKQAIAIALENSRDRALGGSLGVMSTMTKPAGIANRAFGGPPTNPMASWTEHSEARSLMHGPILSSVPGRTDAHKGAVASGSYVVPADIVSGRGQGNTLAGMNVLQRMFKMGPYGTSPGMIRPGNTMPRTGGMMKMPRMAYAGGGKGGHHVGKPVPVNLAGGELVIPPENLMAVVHPNLKHAHAIMDKWVLKEREKLHKTLKKLPGPARD